MLSFDENEVEFTNQIEETRVFFQHMRRALYSDEMRSRRICVELSPINHISLGAALMLVAEFDRWQRIRRQILTPDTIETWCPSVRAKLDALGFFKLLGTVLPGNLRRTREREWIPFVSGVETVGGAAKLLRVRLEALLARESGVGAEIYIAMVESMKNAFQHAYPDQGFPEVHHPAVGKRWWMAASVDPLRQLIKVAFLDLGITIPVSLPYSWMWPNIAKKALSGGDEVLIAEALQYGQSRLQQEHRGKGFRNIRQATMLDVRNRVRVVSGRGACLDVAGIIIGMGAKTKVCGTLIEWEFHLGPPLGTIAEIAA